MDNLDRLRLDRVAPAVQGPFDLLDPRLAFRLFMQDLWGFDTWGYATPSESRGTDQKDALPLARRVALDGLAAKGVPGAIFLAAVLHERRFRMKDPAKAFDHAQAVDLLKRVRPDLLRTEDVAILLTRSVVKELRASPGGQEILDTITGLLMNRVTDDRDGEAAYALAFIDQFMGDQEAVEDFLRKGAELGSFRAQYLYGLLLLQQKEFEDGFAWLSKSESAGFVPAKHTLAKLYSNGFGTKMNVEKAVSLLKDASKAGDEDARITLAMEQITGEKVAKDPVAGVGLLTAAAKAGNPAAANILTNKGAVIIFYNRTEPAFQKGGARLAKKFCSSCHAPNDFRNRFKDSTERTVYQGVLRHLATCTGAASEKCLKPLRDANRMDEYEKKKQSLTAMPVRLVPGMFLLAAYYAVPH